MKMKKLALVLSLLLLAAGCAPAQPKGYVNADPDMVLVTAPGGDITYGDWRLYIDVSEQLNRYMARQSAGLAELLEKDLKAMGVEIDEEAFAQMAAQSLMMASYYDPDSAARMQRVAAESGLADEALNGAMTMDYRLQYLMGLLEEKLYVDIEAGLPPAADDSEEAQELHEQAVSQGVSNAIEDYVSKIDTRFHMDNADALATIDGEDLPYEPEHLHFMDYSGPMGRLDAAERIRMGELVRRELSRREVTADRTEFDGQFDAYLEEMTADETLTQKLSDICAGLGATAEEYYAVWREAMWLSNLTDVYYNTLAEEYGALPEDAPDRPDTAYDYFTAEMEKLLEGSEIVNLSGKKA